MKTIDQIISELVNLNNSHVDEFNQLADTCELQQRELVDLNKWKADSLKTLDAQHKAIEIQQQREQKLKAESNMLSIKAGKSESLEHELKVLRKESKTQKEQVKRLKAASVEKEKKIKRLEKSSIGGAIKGAVSKQGFINNPDLGAIYTLFTNNSNNGEIIQLYPHSLTMRESDKEFKGYVLLHTDNSGAFTTVILNSDHESECVVPIRFSEDTPERTKNLCQKFVTMISPQAAEFCQQWLYRVNVIQQGKLNVSDLEKVMEI